MSVEEGAAPPSRLRRWWWRAPLAAVAGVLVGTVLLVLPWRWAEPPTTMFMLLYGGPEARSEWFWTDLDRIAPVAAVAVIASEDQRFALHRGVDTEAVREALSDGSGRGASTLTQQVAKNLYLWAGRSWIRKGIEAWLAVSIDLLWPKHRILEMYLNVAQFGPATFGIGPASRRFFGVEPASLSLRQASLLAVVLPSPRRMSPASPSAYMEERAAWVRRQVGQLGGAAYLDALR